MLIHVDSQVVRELAELVAGKRLGKEVRYVPLAWNMVGAEVLLADPIREPKESHVHGLGALAVRLAFGDAQCHGAGFPGNEYGHDHCDHYQ